MKNFINQLFGQSVEETIPATDIENAVRKAVTVGGRVQGVGFRFFVQQEAKSLRLTGWVKNLSNGNVTMEIQGAPEIVEEMMKRVKKGNGVGRVDSFESSDLEVVEGENKFAIRY